MSSDFVINPSPVVQPWYDDTLDIAQYSDHLTVWVDRYVGEKGSYVKMKEKFKNNIQPLNTWTTEEEETNVIMPLAVIDPAVLENLKDKAYCLKVFSNENESLKFINENRDKKIFFVTSGTMGKIMVPLIVDLPQIHGIYIFCSNISYHTSWAMEYAEKITSILEHQDDLLLRLTKDISKYLQEKGDIHMAQKNMLKAKNCYAWATKLILRGKDLGDTTYRKSLEIINRLTDLAENGLTAEEQQMEVDNDD